MVGQECTIQDPKGLHARPTSKLVMKAMRLSSNIQISLYQSSTDTKNILEVMALGADRNGKTLVRTSGENEEETLETVKQVLTQENDLNLQRFQMEVRKMPERQKERGFPL